MENIPELHPLRVGELLDKAISLYRRKFLLVTAITATASLPIIAFQVSFDMAREGSSLRIIALVVFGLAALAGGAIGTTCLIFLFGKGYVNEDLPLLEAIKIAMARFPYIIIAAVFQGLALGAPLVLLLCGLLNGVTDAGGVVISILFFVFYIPYAFWFSAHWAVTDQIIVLEGLGAYDSMTRSWHLISPSFWRILWISVATTALTWFVNSLPSILAYLVMVIATPLTLSVYVVVYYDLRVRMEGFGLELMTVSSS